MTVLLCCLRFCLCRVNTAFLVRCFSVQLRLQPHLPQHCLLFANTRQKGPVTDTLLPVTAFDDAVGLMIFSLCFALAQAFASGDALTVQAIVLDPLREIGLSCLRAALWVPCLRL